MAARAIAKIQIDPSKIAGLLAKVANGLYDGVTDASNLIRDEAKTLAPVDTGALRDSIDATVVRGIQNVMASDQPMKVSALSVTGTIAPHVDYAAYVEFGTGQRGAASTGAGLGPYSPNWKGMVAQPYMRPAFDSNRERAVEIVKESVADSLK